MTRILFGSIGLTFIWITYIYGECCDSKNGEIMIVSDIESFHCKYPEAELIVMNMEKLRGQLRYTYGTRVHGDRLVWQAEDNQNYPSLQDVELCLTYPTAGTGDILTYINVLVEQSSDIGEGYIVNGGIGERSAKVLIEANSTLYFAYAALFYGY